MKQLSIVFPYYKNPQMLAYQISIWKAYPTDILENLEIIVVDDGSPVGQRAEEIIAKEGLPACLFRLYRIVVDLPWNVCGARNLGLLKTTKSWIGFCDIDHVMPANTLRHVLTSELSESRAYTFTRIEHVTKETYKPHWETCVMHGSLLQSIGLFDESFNGHYCFCERDWLERRSPFTTQLNMPIERCRLEDFPDCNTVGSTRKVGRDEQAWGDIKEWKSANNIGITVLKLPWKLVLEQGQAL